MTVVGQLITDARTRFGAHDVTALEVEPSVLDQAMDHVLELGGQVGLDSCVVDGVELRELPDGETVPRAHVVGESEPQPLTPLEE